MSKGPTYEQGDLVIVDLFDGDVAWFLCLGGSAWLASDTINTFPHLRIDEGNMWTPRCHVHLQLSCVSSNGEHRRL